MSNAVLRGLVRCAAHGVALVMLLPFALLAMVSLTRSWRYPALWPSAWQFDAWLALGGDGASLVAAALRSVTLATAVGCIATSLGFVTSRVLARHPHERRWMALALLPFAMPPAIFAIALGLVHGASGLSGHLVGVLLAQLPFALAYAVLLCRGYWSAHQLALEELAISLGARHWRLWSRVHWPLARGLLAVCLFQTALMSWFDFALVRMVGMGEVETLTLRVFEYFGAGDLRQASAAALLLVAPPCAALLWRPRLLWPALARRSSS